MGIIVDVDVLRDYMQGCGRSAAFSGFPGAMADVIEAGTLDAYGFCRKAERVGVNLYNFAVDDD